MACRNRCLLAFLILLIVVTAPGFSQSRSSSDVRAVPSDSTRLHPSSTKPCFRDRFFAPDKARHFMFNVISTVFVGKFAGERMGWSDRQSKHAAVTISLGIGLLKEVRDSRQPNNRFSWKDLVADVAGIAVGVALLNQP